MFSCQAEEAAGAAEVVVAGSVHAVAVYRNLAAAGAAAEGVDSEAVAVAAEGAADSGEAVAAAAAGVAINSLWSVSSSMHAWGCVWRNCLNIQLSRLFP